ncbi:cytochrome c1 [Maritalea mobilis]|uniref:cytochrome c1 n=1 Tax=Maritalea mobilis TaxID=483324 RepID=UPI001C93DEF1|nr:cytochrome c1 [Maritalea mobilis]MBY6202911.1 cytochrome c1 [Maritalea mobilis]
MFRKLAITTATALSLGTGAALAAGGGGHVTDYDFTFEGPFGTYDQTQLQRGLQVYTEVCAACHGMTLVPIRSLSDPDGPGLTDEEVRAYIEMNFIEVYDDELQDWRPATPNDHFPEGSYEGAPDLSVMAKARAGFHGPYGLGLSPLVNGIGGPEYIASYLTHYTGEEMEQYGTYLYGNETFDGGWTQMAPPLWDGQVEYADGSPNDIESMAVDVSAFLMWAAEPHLMDRKQMGFTAVMLLILLSALLYLTNKRLWAPVKKAAKARQPAE